MSLDTVQNKADAVIAQLTNANQQVQGVREAIEFVHAAILYLTNNSAAHIAAIIQSVSAALPPVPTDPYVTLHEKKVSLHPVALAHAMLKSVQFYADNKVGSHPLTANSWNDVSGQMGKHIDNIDSKKDQIVPTW